ncbi:hypothetical protein FRB90_000336, partial [Tulasnella sp. 427]
MTAPFPMETAPAPPAKSRTTRGGVLGGKGRVKAKEGEAHLSLRGEKESTNGTAKPTDHVLDWKGEAVSDEEVLSIIFTR